jgi:hypothetical protein
MRAQTTGKRNAASQDQAGVQDAALSSGPTEDDRRAERQAALQRAIEAELDLKWGRLSAGIAGGISGRSVLPL